MPKEPGDPFDNTYEDASEENTPEAEKEKIEEQRIATSKRDQDIITKVVEEMGLDVKFETNKKLGTRGNEEATDTPMIDVVFEGTMHDVEKFIKRVEALRKESK